MLQKQHKAYLEKYISEKYLNEQSLGEYIDEFVTCKYVKHLVFSDFFKKSFADGLKNEIEKGIFQYDEFYTNQEGYKKGTGAYVSGCRLSELYKLFHSEAFYSYMKLFYEEGIHTPIKLWYMIENFFRSLCMKRWALLQIYNSTDYLTWHTDWPIGVAAWSYVFFLSPEWNAGQWGELEFGYKHSLHDTDAVTYKSVLPSFNTLAFFKCEKDLSWHRVNTVKSWKRITYHDQLFYKKHS